MKLQQKLHDMPHYMQIDQTGGAAIPLQLIATVAGSAPVALAVNASNACVYAAVVAASSRICTGTNVACPTLLQMSASQQLGVVGCFVPGLVRHLAGSCKQHCALQLVLVLQYTVLLPRAF